MENLEIAAKYEKVVRLISHTQEADDLKAAFDDYTNSLDFGAARRIKELEAENAALRTIVREIERIADGAGILEDYKSAWRDAAKKLQAALDKINETGQHV